MFYIGVLTLITLATVGAVVFTPTSFKLPALGAGVLLAVVLTGFCSVTYAPTGTIKIERVFGKIQPGYVSDSGLQFVAPWVSLDDVNITRREIDPGDNGTPGEVKTGTADDNFLTVGVIMPYSVNPTFAGRLLARIPNYADVMMPNSANSALRKGVSEHKWTEVVKDTDGKSAKSIDDNWQTIVKEQLIVAGFTPDEAKLVFTFYPVQIRKAVPDDKVQQATANRSAEVENLNMQKTLTDQALEVAKRRSNEGQGLANLIKAVMGLKPDDKMPNLSPSDIAHILNAISTQERATAMMKIADSNRPLTVIMNGDGAGPAAVPAGSPVTEPVGK
ncbi:MAG TPA: hypothetical protein V6C76_01470 [Drouetiella sp.]